MRQRDADQPLAYVRKLMVNTHVSWRRRLMSTEQVVEVAPDRTGDDPQAAHAVKDEVRRALATLSPRVRAVNTHATRGLAALCTALSPDRRPTPAEHLASPERRTS
jgi:DNA-directed RNA polymerase specialized sigma24 family protein